MKVNKKEIVCAISNDCSNRCQLKKEIKTLIGERILIISEAQMGMVGNGRIHLKKKKKTAADKR